VPILVLQRSQAETFVHVRSASPWEAHVSARCQVINNDVGVNNVAR
jgi:hypothetical protein